MAFTRRWKRQAALGALVTVLLVGAIGCLFFLVAMSPCRVDLEPGAMVTYRLSTAVYPMDGAEAISRREDLVHLVCIDNGNELALVSGGAAGERDELTLLQMSSDGRVRRYDPALRLLDEGKPLGFFDFNLLPLPEGLDQDWHVELIYAVPPPGQRRVQARVRRVTNGLNPIFELRLPTIEWIDERTQSGRWCQIKDLVCRYRFNGRQGIVDQADLAFVAGVEVRGEEGARYRRVHLSLLGQIDRDASADPVALKDLALATVDTQTRLEDGSRQGLRPLAARLRKAAEQGPERLRALAIELARAADGQAPVVQGGSWAVQVASVAVGRRTQAQALVDELNADGWPAWLADKGTQLGILIGPYRERDESVLRRLRERFPRERPLWVRAER
ncbi:MAG: SPOR domain-containing protein [Planctomycetota bacterium]|nr:SPOR domain-containing protein [Planctomycetota bacterium]